MSSLYEQIVVLAGDIWSSVLGLPVAAIEPPREDDVSSPLVTGSVGIDGDWQGRVVLQCSTAFAERAATAMFGADATELSGSELNDSIGELANMVSGNVKALLPGRSQLSLPTVAQTTRIRSAAPAPEAEVWLDCEGEVIVVSVVGSGDANESPPAATEPVGRAPQAEP